MHDTFWQDARTVDSVLVGYLHVEQLAENAGECAGAVCVTDRYRKSWCRCSDEFLQCRLTHKLSHACRMAQSTSQQSY